MRLDYEHLNITKMGYLGVTERISYVDFLLLHQQDWSMVLKKNKQINSVKITEISLFLHNMTIVFGLAILPFYVLYLMAYTAYTIFTIESQIL